MLVHRVFPRDPKAKHGERGHWSFLPRPQRHGRWDAPDLYDAWYAAATPVGAIAEKFWSFNEWRPATFLTPHGTPIALAVLETRDEVEWIDLDDPATLIRFGLKPSQIVRRDLAFTQAAAAAMHRATRENTPRPGGLKWWSSALPQEDVFMLWSQPGAPPPFVEVEITDLHIEHPHVEAAAHDLTRIIRP